MADQTTTQTAIQFPTGQQAYDIIMGGIEPELVSSVLPTLDVKYAGETPEAKALRLERYRKAYTEYDKQARAYTDKLEQDIHVYCRDSMKAMEQAHQTEEADALSAVESSIQTQ